MKNAMLKNAFSEIRKSKSRFFSIFGIIAIGTGFFSGLLASAPAMRDTADAYYDKSNLMDFRLVSTYGFDDNDIRALEEIDGINIYPGYFADALVGAKGSEKVARVFSLDKMGENNAHSAIWLTEGRMPENENECLLDACRLVGEYKIGDKITLRGDGDGDLTDTLRITEYEIVGRFNTPMYISDTERGNSTIGTGTVSMVVYIPKENFKTEVYTQVFVTSDDLLEKDSYSDEYEILRDRITDKLESTARTRENDRLLEIKKEAREEILKARSELAKEKAKIYAEIADNEKKLSDAKKEIEDGEKKLAEAAQTLKDSKAELDDAKIQLDEGKAKLEQAEQKLKDSEAVLDKSKAELDKAKKELDDASLQLSESKAQLDRTKQTLDFLGELLTVNEGGELDFNALKAFVDSAEKTGLIDKKTAEELGALFDGTKTEAEIRGIYAYSLIQYNDGLVQYEQAKKQLDDGYAAYYDGEAEYQVGLSLYQSGYDEYIQGVNTYEENRLLYENGLIKYNEGLAEYEDGAELLEQSKKEYEDGVKELEDGKKEADEKFFDAEEAIKENEEEIENLEEIEWYVFTRDDNPGYTEYGENTLRISYIAVVFPLFFVMVAALVCLTTMTRMVDEQRTQIGTLKAMGYTNLSIMSKYVIYASVAAVMGAVAGTLIGLKLFPGVVIIAYGMLYKMNVVVMAYDVQLIVLSVLASVLLVLITVYFSCTAILREQPSALMRPKAPKIGKKILLERVSFIWKRFSFSQKVTMRNLFRYKRRMFMTVVGIAGCTALVLTGFGIYDSVSDIINKQFDEISLHTGIAVYDDKENDAAEEAVQLLYENGLDTVQVYMKSLNIKGNGKTADANIFVVKDDEQLSKCVRVKDRKTGDKHPLTDNGVIINEKLATLLGDVKKGDEITVYITETKTARMKITDVCENYASHYLYVSDEYYKSVTNENLQYNSIFFMTGDGEKLSEKERDSLASNLMRIDGIMAVNFKSTTADIFSQMLQSLLCVIILLIVSAGALAFIVLYNLTNININERIREIATLKVLGFYDKETSVYVFREIMLLTLLGSGIGLALGRVLLDFVVKTIEIDMVMFGREVHTFSFIVSIAITLLFAVIVMLVMHKHLKNIDMVEALKSVE